jgi:hypothetical protein
MTIRLASLCLAGALGLGALFAGCSDSSSSGGGGGTAPQPSPSPSPSPGAGTGSVTVTSIDPASGGTAGGDMIAIQGTGFNSTSVVRFGSSSASVVAGSSTLLVVTSPPGSGATTITVTTGSDFDTFAFSYGGLTGTDVFQFKTGTDKWWLNVEFSPEADADSNGFGDLSEALSTTRNSTGGTGFNDFEGAVGFLFQFTSQFYRNNPDGSLAGGGAPVSFRRGVPGFGNMAPAGFAINPVSALDFNVMALRKVAHIAAGEEQTGVAGRASSEINANNTLENNSGGTTPGGQSDPPLGTFTDAAAFFWNASAIPNSRRTLAEFMQEVAQITAHEIGHSMGLLHSNVTPPAPATVNMMAPSVSFNPTNVYDFDDATFAGFLAYMPGPTRLVHRSAWSPRRLVASSDAVVIGTPRLAEGGLEIPLDGVVLGDHEAGGLLQVIGLAETTTAAEVEASGQSLFFLTQDAQGRLSVGADAYGLPLAGRDVTEWQTLIADYVALRALEGDRAAWTAAYADRLRRSLASSDARIRLDALFELEVQRDVARALPGAAVERLHTLLESAEIAVGERALAACVFTHLGDEAQTARLRRVALGTDEPVLLECLAGALEMSQSLSGAAEAVRAELESTSDANVARRARVLLGWLLDRPSSTLIAQDLRAGGAEARRAADALGRIGDAGSLPALQTLALDAQRDLALRKHALRAIGRIGGDDARAWLTGREQAWSGDLADAARFARDYAESWRIDGR